MAFPESDFVSMRDPASGLSHFSPLPVRFRGSLYPTSEHASRAAMYMWSSPETVVDILFAPSPLDAIRISNEHEQQRRPDWEIVGVPLVREICGYKMLQHPQVIGELMDTGDKLIALDINDEFWGIGRNGTGQNNAGKIWMRWRERLRRPVFRYAIG